MRDPADGVGMLCANPVDVATARDAVRRCHRVALAGRCSVTHTRQRQRRAIWLLNALLGNPKASPMEIRFAVTAVIQADLEAESGMTDMEIAR